MIRPVGLAVLMALVSALLPAQVIEESILFPPDRTRNHSLSVVELPEGGLLAAWVQQSANDGAAATRLMAARKAPGSEAWSDVFPLIDPGPATLQSATLFVDTGAVLWLFTSAGKSSRHATLEYRTTREFQGPGAPVWERPLPIEVRPDLLEATAARVVGELLRTEVGQQYAGRLTDFLELAKSAERQRAGWLPWAPPTAVDGTLLLGLYSDSLGCSLVAWTGEQGGAWHFGEPMIGFGNVQPALVQKRDGTLVALMRNNGASRSIRRAHSEDAGRTWSPVTDTHIPNPGSSIALTRLQNGHWLLVCNDTTGGPRLGRTVLSAYLSDDEGTTWKWQQTLEAHEVDPASANPGVCQSRDGRIHVLYTFSPEPDETIKHLSFDEAWMRQ